MMKRLVLLIAMLLLYTNSSQAKDALYYIPSQHVDAGFTVSDSDAQDENGRFDSVTGSFRYDSSTEMLSNFKLAIDATSLTTSQQQVTLALLNAIGARTWREIVFVQTKSVKVNEETTLIDGRLTLRGSTKTTEIPATIDASNRRNIIMNIEMPVPLQVRAKKKDDEEDKERTLNIKLTIRAIRS